MKKDILDNIEIEARKIAAKHSLINQNKLQDIEINEDEAYLLISEFFEYNLSDLEVEFEDIEEVLNKAFVYFYDKGIESAIKTHFNLPGELVYNQEHLSELVDPDFPESIKLYINNIALLEISNALYQFVINHKNEFDEEGYLIFDIAEKFLLSAFHFGGELVTQIILKSSDFGIVKSLNANLKIDAMDSSHDMITIACPFCHHSVYREPKDKEYRHLAKINNCQHIFLQFFEGKDTSFLMGESFRQVLSESINNFLSAKGDKFIMMLNDFFENPDYNIDDFLIDLYIIRKINKEDELIFLNILKENLPNYDLKVSISDINDAKFINYFLSEQLFNY